MENIYDEIRYGIEEGYISQRPHAKAKFKCKRCGGCCRQRGDIILSPSDVILICRYLDVSVEELMQRYLKIQNFNGIKIPVIKDKGDSERTCIFLENGACKIHKVKPIACYTFPFIKIKGRDLFLVQICCKGTQGADVEEKKITEIIEGISDRYKSDKEYSIRFETLLNELIEKAITQKNQEMIDMIFKKMYLELDVNCEDIEEYGERILDEVEELAIFM